jgi:hypothetical protein
MRMIAAAALCLFSVSTFAASPDEAAVRAVAQKYFEAHATGQATPLLEAFHPEWRMLWVKDGALMKRTRDEYTSGFTGKVAADESERKRSIEMVDITGNAAVVKLRLDYPKSTITDYMLLLKIDGKWQVVTKGFDVAPK